MKKVITYGTYDLLHHGHVRLLERAKALGDYLVVGVTAEDFDKSRGKINVKQPLVERIEAVKATGIADEVIVEEYEGQKIDDILRLGIDVFTVGSDWVGVFDYLAEYCEVVYLDRTEGISSTELRAETEHLRMGLAGQGRLVGKILDEARYINGLEPACALVSEEDVRCALEKKGIVAVADFNALLGGVDAVYLASHPSLHESQIEQALQADKHVLCESPLALSGAAYTRLSELAASNGLVLMDGMKTAYAMAYHRLKLLVKSGAIGSVVSVDATCTSLADSLDGDNLESTWSSMCSWGPTAMLPVFQLLGTNYRNASISSKLVARQPLLDSFSKIDFVFPHAVATVRVGKGVKSEGDLVVSGTKGYVYVPAPWWKTDYFEVRYENPSLNRRFFYQLNGEGMRAELAEFTQRIGQGVETGIYLDSDTSQAIVGVVEQFLSGKIDFEL